MQSRRQIQELLKKQKKSKKNNSEKKDKSADESKKKLKEEVVPHKLKIRSLYSKKNENITANKSSEEKSERGDSNGSKEEQKMM